MGAIYRWKCNKCWHSFKAYLGYGMGGEFPKEVTEAAREGEYGSELQIFLLHYPDAVVNGEQVIVQCEHCYRYEGRPLLAAYRPGMKPNDPDNYICVRDYNHRCRCGHRMWPFCEEDCFAGLPCPRCSGTMKPKSIGLWD